jgi:hypothetical protein
VKQQINFRASDLTARQLEWLMARWGTSQTETVTVVLDRVYRQEQGANLRPLTQDVAHRAMRVAIQDTETQWVWGTVFEVHEGAVQVVWDDGVKTSTRLDELMFDAPSPSRR